MTISPLTVDKLGVKLYDKVSAVIAELVANGYDADAREVTVKAPMGSMLASLSKGKVSDSGYKITVQDNGCGMPPSVVNAFYLTVGGERRKDPERGHRTAKFDRRVMGRKGVGKLAPFGICDTIEVISSGGEPVDGPDKDGKVINGYRTAHFIMKRTDIINSEPDQLYRPEVGGLDNTVRVETGVSIIMRDFNRRRVPDMKTLLRQLAQRFGIQSDDWKIRLIDTNLAEGTEGREGVVGKFQIATMPNTMIRFEGPTTEAVEANRRSEFTILDENNQTVPSVEAGFLSNNGKFYPIKGWVAYARESYRDELMAGIRIYCRGKIAAQTPVFNRKAGFTGEHSVRSYLVGELHADWLDEDEDLIQTDRRDILWSDELGQEFERWGQDIVRRVGKHSREPERERTWDRFRKTGDVEKRIQTAYPGDHLKDIREQAMKFAKLMGERIKPAEVENKAYVKSLVECSIALGPIVSLDTALEKAANEDEEIIITIARILRTARIAELSSYGMIVKKRVKVIERFIKLLDNDDTPERTLQESIEEAPWLINPLWSPITANQQFSTLKDEFGKFLKKYARKMPQFGDFSDEVKARRPDFIMSASDLGIQIIEIKKPNYKLINKDWDRIQIYINAMEKFLDRPGHQEFKSIFRGFTVTLVCDEVGLSASQEKAFNTYKEENTVVHITWSGFLHRTKHMHMEFLEEAKRLRNIAVKVKE